MQPPLPVCSSLLSYTARLFNTMPVQRTLLFYPDVASMVKELGKKGITVKDEPGLSLVRLFGPGVGDEKVNPTAATAKNRSLREDVLAWL